MCINKDSSKYYIDLYDTKESRNEYIKLKLILKPEICGKKVNKFGAIVSRLARNFRNENSDY
jgi:predicted Co/Zn/Cd cation transporter (cation efflux family)